MRGTVCVVVACAMAAAARGDDTPVALRYNFNGMVHAGEAGQPDNPDGFRSISDRALLVDGAAGSFGTSPVTGFNAIPYTIISAPLVLDVVHLGNRVTSGWAYDATVDGDNIGIRPNWDTSPDHTVPQTTTLATPIEMFGNTQIGVLYQISNGGGSFDVVLGFTDATSVTVRLAGPDWYNLPVVASPGAGVVSQSRLGNTNWPATTSNDMAATGVVPTNNLSVIEGVLGVSKMAADGLGNHAGKFLGSITFQNADYVGSNARAYAVVSATVRGASASAPYGVGASTPNPAVVGQPAKLTVAAYRGGGLPNAIAGVVVDGSSIGLGSVLALNDAGQNGDVTPGDEVYSLDVVIPLGAPGGPASLGFTITDAQARTGTGTIDLSIVAPPDATDFGTLGNTQSVFNGTLEAGVVKWLRVTLPTTIDAGASTFLDIDTEGSVLAGGTLANDTMIGLYTGNGARVAFDDDDATDYTSMLTFGAGTRPAHGNGLAYDGRDGGTLPAGTYYLAYCAYVSTFNATNWSVTTTSAHSGTYTINFNTNAGASGCPADLDNDGVLGNGGLPDGAVTIDDLLYFLAAYENGDTAADLDNGTGTGTHDGAVTIDDLLYFLAHYEGGC